MTEKPIEPSGALVTDPHPVPLQAGEEFDRIVEERVFGKCAHRDIRGWYHEGPDGDRELNCGECHRQPHVRRYSTDIASAWEVVEKMAQSYDFYLRFVSAWTAEFITIGGGEIESADSETAPEAICIAALRAIGEVSS